MQKTALRFIAAVLIAVVAITPSIAASWKSTRDAAMTLRERGNPEEAYQAVVSAKVSEPKDVVDRDFVAGFISLRFLGRTDLAATHFMNMATNVNKLKAGFRNESRSQAGYWLGRTLTVAGRTSDANQMYLAAAGYRDTFYGQMAASHLGLKDTTAVLSGLRQHYPDMDIFWHDPRIRKELVLAIIRNESSFKQGAVSHAGAKGLMQIMDGTALRTGREAGINIDLRQVASNGHYNVAVGSKIVADLMQDYNGNILLMAAAYNAGPGRPAEWVKRFGDPRSGRIEPVDWIELIPFSETRNYVKKILSSYVTYLALSSSGR